MQYQNDSLSIHIGAERAAAHFAMPPAAVPDEPGTLSADIISHSGALADAKRAADQEITRLQACVQELSAALADAAEAERTRLGRELHDDVGAHLSATHFALARLETWLPADAPPACAEALALANRTLQSACEASRRLVAGLHAPQLDGGLREALSRLTDEFTERARVPAHLVCDADARLARLTPEAAATLFRLAQEALNNIAKHARATRVDVLLETDRRHLTLVVKDDGRGLSCRASAAPRFGLGGMRARCKALEGTLKIASQDGVGVTVRARLPWSTLLGVAISPRQDDMPVPAACALS